MKFLGATEVGFKKSIQAGASKIWTICLDTFLFLQR